MKIDIPANLNSEEIKCFNEVVKLQLEELYSYNYDIFEFRHVKIFISKDKFPDNIKRPNIEEIASILNKISGNHLKFISEIYFVAYHCREERDDLHKEINVLKIVLRFWEYENPMDFQIRESFRFSKLEIKRFQVKNLTNSL